MNQIMQKVIDAQIKTKDEKGHVKILGMKDIDPTSIVILSEQKAKKQKVEEKPAPVKEAPKPETPAIVTRI